MLIDAMPIQIWEKKKKKKKKNSRKITVRDLEFENIGP